MSRHLFTYRDLLRIHTKITPDRAPGRTIVEIPQILLLIGDLVTDLAEAIKEGTQIPVVTVVRDALLELWIRIGRLMISLGIGLVDAFVEIVGEEREDGESP